MLTYVYLCSNIHVALLISILTIFQRTLLKVIITQPPKGEEEKKEPPAPKGEKERERK